jgi:hypothetical protein
VHLLLGLCYLSLLCILPVASTPHRNESAAGSICAVFRSQVRTRSIESAAHNCFCFQSARTWRSTPLPYHDHKHASYSPHKLHLRFYVWLALLVLLSTAWFPAYVTTATCSKPCPTWLCTAEVVLFVFSTCFFLHPASPWMIHQTSVAELPPHSHTCLHVNARRLRPTESWTHDGWISTKSLCMPYRTGHSAYGTDRGNET